VGGHGVKEVVVRGVERGAEERGGKVGDREGEGACKESIESEKRIKGVREREGKRVAKGECLRGRERERGETELGFLTPAKIVIFILLNKGNYVYFDTNNNSNKKNSLISAPVPYIGGIYKIKQ
jgi:hypothetical protein